MFSTTNGSILTNLDAQTLALVLSGSHTRLAGPLSASAAKLVREGLLTNNIAYSASSGFVLTTAGRRAHLDCVRQGFRPTTVQL